MSVPRSTHTTLYVRENRKDASALANDSSALVLLWSDGEDADGFLSLPRLTQTKTEQYLQRYLSWSQQLAATRFGEKSLSEHFQFSPDAVSLWWMSPIADKSSYQHSYIFETFKLWAFEELLQDTKVHSVNIRLNDAKIANSLAAHTRSLALKTLVSATLPTKLSSLLSNLKAPVRAASFLLRERVRSIPSRKDARERGNTLAGSSVLFSYAPNFDQSLAADGIFRSAYWSGLEDVIEQDSPRTWILSYVRSGQMSFSETRSALKTLNQKSDSNQRFLLLESFSSWRVFLATLATSARLAFTRSKLPNFPDAFRYSENKEATNSISFWCTHQHYANDFFFGKTGVETAWYTAVFSELARNLENPKMGLYCWENCPWEHALVAQWQARFEAPVVGYQHSSVSANDLRIRAASTFYESNPSYPLPTQLLCNSPYVESLLLGDGLSTEKVTVVEAHRYAALAKQRLCYASPLPEKERKLFVALDAVEEVAAFQMRLLELAVANEQLSDYSEVRVKAHPFSRGVHKTFQGSLGERVQFVDLRAEELIEWSDVTIAPNSSTIALEVAWKGRHAILIANPLRLNLSPLVGIARVTNVLDSMEFEKQLRNPKRIEVPDNLFCFSDSLQHWRSALRRACH